MAITIYLKKKFREFIPFNETILATVSSCSAFEMNNCYLCITDKRLAVLINKFFWRWEYYSISFQNIKAATINQGLFDSKLMIVKRNGEEIELQDIDKIEARDFISELLPCIEQDNELISQRTKVCPDCDEIIKFKARVCKYCGYRL